MTHLKLGTRSSPLALAQSNLVLKELNKHDKELTSEIIKITTSGDKILDKPLAQIGGKGLFTKELDVQLINKNINIAVHSLKDLPSELPSELTIGAVLKREEVNDLFISNKYETLESLPSTAIIGTSSLRRTAFLKMKYPKFSIIPFRGNLQTRLKKLSEQNIDATILALAGFKRLNYNYSSQQIIDTSTILPAPSQGAIAVVCRKEDYNTLELLEKINHSETQLITSCERAFLKSVDGSCRIPIAALAKVDHTNNMIHLKTALLLEDGSEAIFTTNSCSINLSESITMGEQNGKESLTKASSSFIKKLYNSNL